jgi:hypothetical protein
MPAVRDLIGLQWKEDGRDWKGVNCYGLARLARKHLQGLDDLPAYDGRYHVPLQRSELKALIATERDLLWRKVPLGQEQLGDFMLWRRPRGPHIAFVTKPGWMLHVEEGINSVHVRYPSLEFTVSHLEGIHRYVGVGPRAAQG